LNTHLGDGGAGGRERWRSGSGTAALGDGGAQLGDRDGDGAVSAWRCKRVGPGRVMVPTGTSKPFYIVNNHKRILRKTACDI
jgi:hypothetical protein